MNKLVSGAIVALLMVIPVRVFAQEDRLQQAVDSLSAGEIMDTIEYLSDPRFEGRLSGTEGYRQVMTFAAKKFERWGLTPAENGYIQPWEADTGKVHGATLEITISGDSEKPVKIVGEYIRNFHPFIFSGSGKVDAPIVFAGYGMTAPEFGVDDYAGVDVKGKLAMIIKGAPDFRDGEDWLTYNTHTFRTQNAYDHGAVGVLYVTRPIANPNGNRIAGFPLVQISRDVADEILKPHELNVESLIALLKKRRNVSFETGATAKVAVESEPISGMAGNVVGMIPGTDPDLRHEAVVIGGHLDHCGAWPVFTPGSDDNASGAATVMAMARAAAEAGLEAKRTLVFVLFGGEEMGLLGSKHFVENLPAPATTVRFALNLDMVGAGDQIFVLGLKKDPAFADRMQAVSDRLGLVPKLTGNERIGGGGSDHGPFVDKGWPAVSVFSSGGDHHGYHTPADTPYFITPLISRDIAKLVLATAVDLADEPPSETDKAE